MYPVECVARGYLTGSGLLDYRATGEVCGIALPEGLEDGSRLPSPIFTPASKAAMGDHDENISYESVVGDVGETVAAELRDLTLAVYARAEGLARERGIILADTKLEFGARLDTGTSAGRNHGPRRRGAHPRLQPLLAGRRLAARARPELLRQADRAQLAALRGERLGPLLGHPATAAARPTSSSGPASRYVEAYELLTGERF